MAFRKMTDHCIFSGLKITNKKTLTVNVNAHTEVIRVFIEGNLSEESLPLELPYKDF